MTKRNIRTMKHTLSGRKVGQKRTEGRKKRRKNE